MTNCFKTKTKISFSTSYFCRRWKLLSVCFLSLLTLYSLASSTVKAISIKWFCTRLTQQRLSILLHGSIFDATCGNKRGKKLSMARLSASCEADNPLQDLFYGNVLKRRKGTEIFFKQFLQLINGYSFYPKIHDGDSGLVFRTQWKDEKTFVSWLKMVPLFHIFTVWQNFLRDSTTTFLLSTVAYIRTHSSSPIRLTTHY